MSRRRRRTVSRLVVMETIGCARFNVMDVTSRTFRSGIRVVTHGMSSSWSAYAEPIWMRYGHESLARWKQIGGSSSMHGEQRMHLASTTSGTALADLIQWKMCGECLKQRPYSIDPWILGELVNLYNMTPCKNFALIIQIDTKQRQTLQC
jgi:hypothetical protein